MGSICHLVEPTRRIKNEFKKKKKNSLDVNHCWFWIVHYNPEAHNPENKFILNNCDVFSHDAVRCLWLRDVTLLLLVHLVSFCLVSLLFTDFPIFF